MAKTIKERSRDSLDQAIKAAGIPFDGISGFPPSMRLDFQATATEQQRQKAQAIAAAWDWSDAAQLAREDANTETEFGFGKIDQLKAKLADGTLTPAQTQKVLLFLVDKYLSSKQ